MMTMKLILTPGLCICAALSGCGCTLTEDAGLMPYVEPSTPPAVVGLALYEPQSDVASLTPAVRHVLNPDVTHTLTENSAVAGNLIPAARAETGLNANHQSLGPQSQRHSAHQSETVLNVWQKYCTHAQDLTASDWAIIDRTNMPSELESIWSRECTPLK